MSVPDGTWILSPVRLSDGEGAGRPHTDTLATDDGITFAASWEQYTPRGLVIHGRVGELPIP